jgi:hypothetical protein
VRVEEIGHEEEWFVRIARAPQKVNSSGLLTTYQQLGTLARRLRTERTAR